MPYIDNLIGYDYTSTRTPPFVPRRRNPWEDEQDPYAPTAPPPPMEPPPPRQAQGPPQPPQERPSPLDPLRQVVAEGPPPLPKMNPWKQAGKIATSLLWGDERATQVWNPKYNRQLDEYGQRVKQAKDISEFDLAEEKRQAAIAQAEADLLRSAAQAKRDTAMAEKYEADMNRPDKETLMTEITAERGQALGILPDADGKYRVPSSQIAQIKPSERAEPNVNEYELRRRAAAGDTVAQKAVDSLDKARASRRSGRGGDGVRRGSPGQFANVDARQKKQLREMEGYWGKVIDALKKQKFDTQNEQLSIAPNLRDPNMVKAAKDRVAGIERQIAAAEKSREDEKQSIYDEYAGGLNALGGEAVPAEAGVGRGAPAAAQTAPQAAMPAQGPAAPTLTEAEVRRRATMAGKDPNDAVRRARAAKLIP